MRQCKHFLSHGLCVLESGNVYIDAYCNNFKIFETCERFSNFILCRNIVRGTGEIKDEDSLREEKWTMPKIVKNCKKINLPFSRYPRHRSSFSYSLKLSIPSLSRSKSWYKLCKSSNSSSPIFNSSCKIKKVLKSC